MSNEENPSNLPSNLPGASPSVAALPGKPARGDALTTLLLLFMCVAFVLVNLATGTRNPRMWHDEIISCDPAANLVIGRGFTSSAMGPTGRHEFYGCTSPLYPLLLAGWFRILGIGLLAARSLNYVLMVGVVAGLIAASRRSGLITTRWPKVVLATALLCNFGISFNYRVARCDVLGMLLCVMFYLEFTIANSKFRRLALALTAALLPAAGLQNVPFIAAVFLVVLLIGGWRLLPDMIIVGAGIIVGVAAIAGVLQYEHVLSRVFRFTFVLHGYGPKGGNPATDPLRVVAEPGFPLKELVSVKGREFPSLVLLLGLAGAALITPIFRGDRSARRLAIAAVLCAIVIPITMHVAGHFPAYYAWMMFLPTLVCFCACLDRLVKLPGSRAGLILASTAALLTCYGLPGHLTKAILQWKQNDPQAIARFVKSVARPSDVIYCNASYYFAAKETTPDVMTLEYRDAMSPAERDSVSLILFNPADVDVVTKWLGGRWKETGEFFPAGLRDNSSYQPGLPTYVFCAYRRDPAPAPSDADHTGLGNSSSLPAAQ